ncbi:Zn(II)2Cys6 transcription factor [Aspergillus ellipticus CBS 707.79]|uniref:Zn(II)2Cys6 transcription factor n=1 Tax=Aspergillus ellipticus CBS 707.79 TaxID=1448320 RepID=A0A319DMA8_9EURO|nr:Zn(II)2Cys6 transcription factor [Aspergillus ellipticus CBS 707.79]
MVYRGKPSSACAWCRSRRLKCDRKRPSCSSCLRAKRTCTGYRDVVALSFADQTNEVIGKARRRLAKPAVDSSPYSTSTSMSTFSTTSLILDPSTVTDDQAQPGPLTLHHVPPPIKDDGVAFVLTHLVGKGPSYDAHLYFLPALLEVDSSPAVMASVNAAGLATLANIQRCPRLMLEARRQYTTALSQTNVALNDQARATTDSTLAAVLLLGIYEIITCDGSELMARWEHHIDGAMRMVELRGTEQLQTQIGLGLFMQLRSQFALSNIYRKKPTHPLLLELSRDAPERRGQPNNCTEQLFAYLTQASDLCARISHGSHGGPTEIIREALKLEADLIAWALNVDSGWQYSVVNTAPDSTTDSPFRPIYGDYYHVYSEVNSVVIWNTYRLTRLVVHEIIGAVSERMCQISKESAQYQTVIQRSVEVSRQLAEDICASVPFVFRHSGIIGPGLRQASGGMFRLHWALFVAADCLGSTPQMQEWILNCLDQIGYNSGIRQALSMSHLLRKGGHLEWLTRDFRRLEVPPEESGANSSDISIQ